MADQIHALVHAVKALLPDPAVDRAPGHPEVDELPAGDDAVLAPGELGDAYVENLHNVCSPAGLCRFCSVCGRYLHNVPRSEGLCRFCIGDGLMRS